MSAERRGKGHGSPRRAGGGGRGSAAGKAAGAKRFLLDACVFDLLLADEEASAELAERRDLRLLASPIVMEQLAATPDPERRQALLALAGRLCALVAAPIPAPTLKPGDAADLAILAAARAARATFVSDDRRLLDLALREGAAVLEFRAFLRLVVFDAPGRR